MPRSSKSLPTMLNYAVHAENGSMYNTPPCFGIYLMGLVAKWALAEGGLTAIAKRNERKAGKLYAEIDRTGFYRGTAEKGVAVADERDVPACPARSSRRPSSRNRLRPDSTDSRAIARSAACARQSTTRFPKKASTRSSSSCRSSRRRTGRTAGLTVADCYDPAD